MKRFTKYHVALHRFLEQALLCYDTAFRILKDNLEIKAQETSSPGRRNVLQKCFDRFLVWTMPRVQSVKRLVKVASRNCLRRWETERIRLVRAKHAGLQCVPFANGSAGVLKLSVTSTLRSRRTALPKWWWWRWWRSVMLLKKSLLAP